MRVVDGDSIEAEVSGYGNVSTGLVSQWERGEKRPRGASLKLLTLVAKNGLGRFAMLAIYCALVLITTIALLAQVFRRARRTPPHR